VASIGKWGNTQDESFAWRATAVAIGTRYVITAKHNLFLFGILPPTYVEGMQFLIGGDNEPYNVVQIWLLGFGDVAIVRVDQDIASYSDIYRGNSEVGNTAELVGYGQTGTQNQQTGQWSFTDSYGTQRHGYNRISELYYPTGDQVPITEVMRCDFDGTPFGLGLVDHFGDGGPVTGEALPGYGDSGGGAFIDGDLAGLMVGTADPPNFGSVFSLQRIGTKQKWIDAVLAGQVGTDDRFVDEVYIAGGTYVAGSYDDTVTSDNGRLQFSEPDGDDIDISMSCTYLTNQATYFTVSVELSGTSGTTAVIQLMNQSNSQWVTIGTLNMTGSDVSHTYSVSPSTYIHATYRRCDTRIIWQSENTSTHTGAIDRIVWHAEVQA
jgi:hypothetical protein